MYKEREKRKKDKEEKKNTFPEAKSLTKCFFSFPYRVFFEKPAAVLAVHRDIKGPAGSSPIELTNKNRPFGCYITHHILLYRYIYTLCAYTRGSRLRECTECRAL